MKRTDVLHVRSKVDAEHVYLAHSDGNAGIVLQGQHVEAQYECFGSFLVFLTYDCPFEESLIVYYLRSDLRVLDDIELGIPYDTGELTRVEVITHESVEFSFFGEDRWRLTVSDKARWRVELPAFMWPRPRGLCFRTRDLGARRYLHMRQLR